MQFFQTNIKALAPHNKDLAQKLQEISELEHFEVFMDNEDIHTLNLVHTQHFLPLYEGSPAQTLEAQMLEYQKFAKYPYLFFYGMGNGVLLKHLLTNKTHQRIIVIEPELEILYIVLHLIDFATDLKNGRLVIMDAPSVDFPNLIGYFLEYSDHKYARTYQLEINSSYYEKLHFEHMQHSNRVFIEAIYHSVNIAGNNTEDALIGLKHHIANLARLLETPPLFDLLQKLHTCDTAVLVSTGPSLTKQIPLLKEIAPYVRIIAVDASFPVLYKAGIKPDVVVSIERVKESARFFVDMPKEAFDDVVFAMSSVQHKEVVQSIKGGTMQMSMRPLGFMMYLGPDEWGYLGLGQSAANMAYELIYHSKFKNCILIGQDLAYSTDGRSHASGHVFGETNVQTKESDVWVKGWGDKEQVRTNHTWDMFRKSFEKDIVETKQSMLTINATEGGVSIYGALEIPFDEAIDKYISTKEQQAQIKLLRAAAFERERLAKTSWQKVQTMHTYITDLLEQSKAVFLEIAQASEQTMDSFETNELEDLVHKAQAIKARYNEEIYNKVAWHIAQSTMLSKEIALVPAEIYIAKDATDEKERLWHLVQAYKPWLFLFAGIMDAIVKTIDYAKVRRLIDEVERIDVFAGDEKIDSFTCHELEPEKGRVFDVDMRGIFYDVPDSYQEKINAVAFRDAKSTKELPRAFVDIIKRDDDKYCEYSFLNSLTSSMNNDAFSQNNISFFATKINMQDKSFVDYLSALKEIYRDCHFNAFYISDEEKKFIPDIFDSKKISTIEDVLNHTHIFIHNDFDGELEKWYAIFRKILYKKSKNILNIRHDTTLKDELMADAVERMKSSKLILEHQKYGFTSDELLKNDYNYYQINFQKALQDSHFTTVKFKHRFDLTHVEVIRFALENQKFVNYMHSFNNIDN